MSTRTDFNVDDLKIGFAKLQGEDFVYYMQSYSFIIGHDAGNARVDVDLGNGGPGRRISHHHARIYFDFRRMQFALEVIGQTGCFINSVLHLPGSLPVQLKSQDLIQIGNKKFYFLLPLRSFWKTMEERNKQAGPSEKDEKDREDEASKRTEDSSSSSFISISSS